MVSPRSCLLALMTLSCVAASGCLNLGPQVRTEFVLIKPGLPMRCLDDVEVRAQRLDGKGLAAQNVAGWVMMPPGDWEATVAYIQRLEAGQVIPQRIE